jgi:regulatory protein
MNDDSYRRTVARAVRLLAARSRSRAELRERLLAKADDATVDRAIQRLEQLGYLNEERFAASFASSRIAKRPIGSARLRQELHRRQVASDVAETALKAAYEETSEEKLIDRAIARRIRARGKPTTREETHKLFAHLMRQGFGYDLVMKKIRKIALADDLENIGPDVETN